MATLGVIIPVYNTGNYLKECLDSIARQSYKDFLAVMIDDGSSDNSGDICDEFAKFDERFIVIHKKNEGVSIARNTGLDYLLKHDDIKYISFIDSDDYIDDGMFETMILSMEKTGSDISVCNICDVINGEAQEIEYGIECKESYIFHEELVYWFFAHITKNHKVNIPYYLINPGVINKIYSRKIIEGVYFETDIKFGEDHLFNLKALSNAESMSFCKQGLYKYRILNNSLSHGEKDLDWLSYVMAKRRIDLFINSKYEGYGLDGYIIHVLNCMKKYAKNADKETFLRVYRDYIPYQRIYNKYKRGIKAKYRINMFFARRFHRTYYFIFKFYEKCFQMLRKIKRKIIRKKQIQ